MSLISFAQERVQSLISKKLGAAVIGEAAAAGEGSIPSGLPTIVYLIAQALVDAAKSYGESKKA
jgi:ABC-type thiamin/hydroxymethylpyrimidine transport system permease subunit|tara:strand:+ start:261 stop:452 length:192 start_codon:yes stop_codon:yes gene_type:complete